MKNEVTLNSLVSDISFNGCQKLIAQIAKAKETVLAQFRDLVADHEQVLRLALNEAEALAWQSRYPQLVFPDLAQEKAQSVVKWLAHQRDVYSASLEA